MANSKLGVLSWAKPLPKRFYGHSLPEIMDFSLLLAEAILVANQEFHSLHLLESLRFITDVGRSKEC